MKPALDILVELQRIAILGRTACLVSATGRLKAAESEVGTLEDACQVHQVQRRDASEAVARGGTAASLAGWVERGMQQTRLLEARAGQLAAARDTVESRKRVARSRIRELGLAVAKLRATERIRVKDRNRKSRRHESKLEEELQDSVRAVHGMP